MAPAGGGLKGFFRQRKIKDAGVVKPPPKKRSKNAEQQQQCANIQKGAAADDGDDGCGAEEAELRLFDMDMTYGPCIGVTRLRRWERAAAMGLSPPPHLRDLIIILQQQQQQQQARDDLPPLKSSINAVHGRRSISLECLWAGKV
ncbi:hypothetical protein EJB05_47845, partial [Eragrostis curvula]